MPDPIAQQLIQALCARCIKAGVPAPLKAILGACDIAASHLWRAEDGYNLQLKEQIETLLEESKRNRTQISTLQSDRHNASRALPTIDYTSSFPHVEKHKQLEAEADQYRAIADEALKDPDTSWDVYEAAQMKWASLTTKRDQAYSALQAAEQRLEEVKRRKDLAKEEIERRFAARVEPLEKARNELDGRFNSLIATRDRRLTEAHSSLFKSALTEASFVFWEYVHSRLPIDATYGKSFCPVRDVIGADVVDFIRRFLQPITNAHDGPHQLFSVLSAQIQENETRIQRQLRGANWHDPYSGLSPAEIVEGLFAGTPLKALFDVELAVAEPTVPVIADALWYSHALLLARTRLGKTNVIRWRLQQLLPQIADGAASVVLMEPKGVLTNEILHLADVGKIADRVVILDPRDTRASVNLFDKGDGSDFAIQETIARVSRVLNTITTTLTPFQLDALMFALRATFCVDAPGSMRLLMRILRNGITDLPVRDLPFTVAEFFDDPKSSEGARQQVVTRLNGLLATPTFEALFAADRTTFDMFNEIQAGKLIVINASAADNLYARFWIEQVSSCITPRFDLLSKGGKLVPTTFVIDEAQTWIAEDFHFAEILDKAAEAKIGMLIAAHHMGQITNLQVRGSIYTNTTLKFAAQTSEDIYALCRSMGRTEHDFIQTLPRYEFAYFGPNMDTAARVKFPLVEFDQMPRVTEDQYQALRARNRERYNYVRSQVSPTPQAPSTPALTPKIEPPIVQEPPEPVINHDPSSPSKESW